MIRRLLILLKQPYPLETSLRKNLTYASFTAVFVALFLFIFSPFGLDTIGLMERLRACLAYGFVTFACMLLWWFIFVVLLGPFLREEKWTLFIQLLYTMGQIGFIGFSNLLLSSILFQIPLTIFSFLMFQLITLSVAVFPVSFFTINNQLRLNRKFISEAGQISNQIEQDNSELVKEDKGEPAMLQFQALNGSQTVELEARSVLYLEAADNYVKIHYLKELKTDFILLRSSLKQMEQELVAFPQFVRCHRAFIVNLSLVRLVSGNAQGFKLHLLNDELVPVSRNLNDFVKEKLLHLKN